MQNVCVAGPAGAGGAGSGAAGSGAAGVAGDDTVPVAPGCEATCATPAGTAQALDSIDATYTAIQGRWEFCDSASWRAAGAPADAIGIDFAPASRATTSNGASVGGMTYYLVAGPSGPVRGQGFAYQLTYDLSPLTATSPQLDIHPMPNSGFGGTMRYSPCPTELQIDFITPQQPATLLRFAPGDGVEHGGADASSDAPDGGADAEGGSSTDGPQPIPI